MLEEWKKVGLLCIRLVWSLLQKPQRLTFLHRNQVRPTWVVKWVDFLIWFLCKKVSLFGFRSYYSMETNFNMTMHSLIEYVRVSLFQALYLLYMTEKVKAITPANDNFSAPKHNRLRVSILDSWQVMECLLDIPTCGPNGTKYQKSANLPVIQLIDHLFKIWQKAFLPNAP